MSSSTVAPPAQQIRTSLADQPRTHLRVWCEQLEAFAASLCREWGPAGALGLASTRASWQAFPGNELAPADPANGTPALYAARPVFTLPTQHATNATAAVVSLYKEEVKKYQAFNVAKALLSTAILESIGPDNVTHLRNHHAPLPIYALHPLVMMETMCTRHGVLNQSDLELLREPLNVPLAELAKLEKHMSDFRLASIQLELSGQGLTPFQLFESFLTTLTAFPSVPQCMSTFYGHNPVMNNHTIDLLFPFLRSQLPFLMSQSGSPQFSGAATGSTNWDNSNRQAKLKKKKAPKKQKWSANGAVLGAKGLTPPVQTPDSFDGSPMHAAMAAEIDRLHCALAAGYAMPNKPPQTVPAPAPQPAATGKRVNGMGYAGQFYCWQHGFNNTHKSCECRVMENDSQYTDAMKTAISPHESGGNPNVGPPVRLSTPTVLSPLPPTVPYPLWSTHRTTHRPLIPSAPSPSLALAVKPAPLSHDDTVPASAPQPVRAVRPAWTTPRTPTTTHPHTFIHPNPFALLSDLDPFAGIDPPPLHLNF